MIKSKFPFKRWIIKSIINLIVFILLLLILTKTKLPEKFDSYVYYKDFQANAWLLLIAYRFTIYFLYPFIVSGFEAISSTRKCIPFKYRLLENFNIQFFTYTFATALYALLGLDKILGTDIFGSSDSFMFIGSFIFTLLINKSLPFLFYDGNSDNVTYDRKVFESVDLSSIRHDSNPFRNSRNYLKYEYNNAQNGDELIIVLKNPSKSFVNGIEPSKVTNCIDTTTYNVMKSIDEYNKTSSKKYNKITILNLFPEFSTEPEIINKIYKFEKNKRKKPNTKSYKYMHKLILKKLNCNCDVIFAWGKNSGIYKGSYDIAIEDMKKHFESSNQLEYMDGSISKCINEYPLHGQIWDSKKSSESSEAK